MRLTYVKAFAQEHILHICFLKEMLPDLVRHPSFLNFRTFLSNVREYLFFLEKIKSA